MNVKRTCILRVSSLSLGVISLLLWMSCSDPLGPGSRRLFFRNDTSASFLVRTQVDRLGMPVESWVSPGEEADISLVSLDEPGSFLVQLFPEGADGNAELEVLLTSAGEIDTVYATGLLESGDVDDVRSDTLQSRLSLDKGFASRLIIEGREIQQALRVFVANRLDTSLTVAISSSIGGEIDTVVVPGGRFPVSEILSYSETDSVVVSLLGAEISFPREKDILIEAGEMGAETVRRIFELPPDIRTAPSEIYFRILAE
jgi:hypothetical protein